MLQMILQIGNTYLFYTAGKDVWEFTVLQIENNWVKGNSKPVMPDDPQSGRPPAPFGMVEQNMWINMNFIVSVKNCPYPPTTGIL